jgi:energy-coupling factor transporter ATP-binding protein EcfA2
MRILELEIRQIRGIRELTVHPDGSNIVIWGPNGAGKSGVIDAVDFLLTGSISRLRGPGTGGISLSEHGPHIDSHPDAAFVRALVKFPMSEEPVELTRSVGSPSHVVCENSVRPQVEAALDLARRGQHVLTRREILRFVTAEAGTRAQEIQTLLDLTPIENIRRALVTIKNDLRELMEGARSSLSLANDRLRTLTGAAVAEDQAVLSFVNGQRVVLGARPLADLSFPNLKADTNPPTLSEPAEGVVNKPVLHRAITTIRAALSPEAQQSTRDWETSLRSALDELRSDPGLRSESAREELSRLGLRLLGDQGTCPLCDIAWPEGELQAALTSRLAKAERSAALNKAIRDGTNRLRERSSELLASVETIAGQLPLLGLEGLRGDLGEWIGRLSTHTEDLQHTDSYLERGFTTEDVMVGFAPDTVTDGLKEVEDAANAACVRVSPEQEAWDVLTRVEEALAARGQAAGRFHRDESAHTRAVRLHEAFGRARDAALGQLYDEIKDRFVELYSELHDHEPSFDAELRPSGPGLEFKVEFLGRGVHPPHALHSEGHQDSMGICLYLALAEKLTAGTIDLIMLDDVMMSVDAEHRRALANLLATRFPHRQLIITTHDRSWANQLRAEGVVVARSTLHFSGWDVDTGPRVLEEKALWDRMAVDLASNDVPTAAHRLRRGAEDFFAEICDGLEARVRFRTTSRLELGDLIPAAMSRYKELIRLGKSAAQSWGDSAAMDRLVELDSVASQIFDRTQVEQWAINDNVHYNSWANFTPDDFQPVIDAFQDLFDMFRCPECETLLRVATTDSKPSGVSCRCGRLAWTLVNRT